MEVTIECPVCGAGHIYEFDPGERSTRWYPGSPASVEHVESGCDCGNICDDQLGYWREMKAMALAEVRERVEMESPFDTVEEMLGER